MYKVKVSNNRKSKFYYNLDNAFYFIQETLLDDKELLFNIMSRNFDNAALLRDTDEQLYIKKATKFLENYLDDIRKKIEKSSDNYIKTPEFEVSIFIF